MIAFQHDRSFVELRYGQILDDAVFADVAEKRDLFEYGRIQGTVTAQDDHIRMDAHALQFFDGVLGRFCLVLIAAAEVRNERDMDVEDVVLSDFQPDLPDGFQERLALDVAGRTADLGDDDIRFGALGKVVDIALDLVGNMGNDLHGLAQVGALALLVQHVPVNLAGGKI